MRRVTETVLDALYPCGIKCVLCGRELLCGQEYVCGECAGLLAPYQETTLLEPALGFCAGYAYEGAIVKAVYRLKYENGRYLARFFADGISIPEDWTFEVIVPVPLYSGRQKRRGYNQSGLIAVRLSETTGASVETELLNRKNDTVSQTMLSAAQRTENVKGAFVASGGCAGRRILLIDDVCTTGSTLAECARTLIDAGAGAVYAAAACVD